MKLSSIITKFFILSLSFSAFFDVAFAQDAAQGGGGESAAESSVTSSSSKKAAVLPEAVESNPIVTIIRSGLSVSEIKTVLSGSSSVSKTDLRSITRSGDRTDLKNVVTSVKKNEVELKTVSQITAAKGSSKNALGRAKVIKTITDDMKENGIDSDNVDSILTSLLDPTIETFGSNSDSATEILAKVNQAEERVAVVVDVEARIKSGELNDELASSVLSASISTDVDNTFDKAILEKQVTTIVAVVQIYGGDASAVSSNDNLDGLLGSINQGIIDDNIKDDIINRVETIKDIETKIESGELNEELAASVLAASKDTASTFNKESSDKQITNIVEIVQIYGGDAAAVASNDNLAGLLSSDLDVTDVKERVETIKDVEEKGLSGTEVEELISKLNNTDTSSGDDPIDIEQVIADANQIIAQSVITGNTEFNDDSSDGGASSGDDSTTIDLGDYDLDDTDSVAKLQFVGNFVNDGISQEVSEEIFEIKDQLSLDLDTNSDRSKLASALKLGFSLDEIKNETNFDYDFYSAAYATEGGDSFSGGLSIDQAKEAKSLGYEISDLNNLSELVNNFENDGSYTVLSLSGKNLSLIIEILELDSADFSQSEALAIEDSSYTSQDLYSIHNLKQVGFAVVDILGLSTEDYTYYIQAYSEVIGDVRLSKDELVKAKANGYELNEISNLTLLVKNPDNDGSYTVDSLTGKDLALIVEALELDSADFSQAEALAIGGSSYTSQDLDSIDTLKNSVTYHELTGTPLDDEGTLDYSTTSLNVNPINVSEILGFSPEQISKLVNYSDPGVSYALFRTLQNFSQESDIDTNLEGIGQLVSNILVNRTSFSDVPAYNADDVLNQGYIDELAYFLDTYNILGQNGSELLSFINDGNSITKENYLSGYIKYLAAYTGSRTFGDDFDTSVADIPLDNVTLLPGANFEIEGNHDVSDLIDPAPITNNNVNSDDIKILVAGAAKDFTITGDLTIHNDNKVEDHALVLAAADDLYLRSEYSSANANDYSNPDPINIEYTGSNLAIASQDTMVLVNANISTGGNLAIGTLDELHIGLSDNHHSVITLGTGGKTPSPDNLYLYANDLISVNGLDIEGYVSKVYMEAHTIALRGVHFPTDSRVMLRSKIGELNFNATPINGYVNLYDSSHASIRDGANLVRGDFEGSVGHYNSIAKHPNGDPYISVRAQQAN